MKLLFFELPLPFTLLSVRFSKFQVKPFDAGAFYCRDHGAAPQALPNVAVIVLTVIFILAPGPIYASMMERLQENDKHFYLL